MRQSFSYASVRSLLAFCVVSAGALLTPARASASGGGCPVICASSCPAPPYLLCTMAGGTCGIGHTCSNEFGSCGLWSTQVNCLGGTQE